MPDQEFIERAKNALKDDLYQKIIDVVKQFVNDELNEDLFLSEFSRLSYNIHKRDCFGAKDLSRFIESKLADVYAKRCSLLDLRQSLKDDIVPVHVVV